MATATRDVPFTKSAYTKQTAPNTVFPTNSSTSYLISTDDGNSNSYKRMYFGGANTWPESLKRNKILSASLRLYVRAGYSLGIYASNCADFNPSQVTYYNHPDHGYDDAYRSAADAGLSPGSWGLIWLPFEEHLSDYQPRAAIDLLRSGACCVDSGYWTSNLGDSPWYVRTVLSNGAAPFIRIEYDDAVLITSVVSFTRNGKLPSTVNPRYAQTVSWELSSAGGGRCVDETWTQASASFLWASDGVWHEIPATGSNMSLTIPAYTFPTGKTIFYKVRCTDTDGTTTETDVFQFSTPASKITPQNSPTSGYKNPREDITFSWYFANTAGTYPQQSASLFWREAGTENWTEVQASGSETSLTIPANTFPTASAVEWYLFGADSSGSTSQTTVYTFSTTASTAYAKTVRPISSVEDGSQPITFVWTLESADGLAVSRVDLWWKLPSESSQQWHEIHQDDEAFTEWTVNAGYFPAGEIQWLVHAFNIDGTRGPDSIASFVCVDAPDPVLGLSATPVPLTTISWQSSGQEAYEISIDGEVVRKSFGPAVYSWQVEEPLSQGEHSIQVRIQGIYGLWSPIAETSVQVGGPVTGLLLSGSFGIDATLSTNDSNSGHIIRYYRDGKFIGTAPGGAVFPDRRVLGSHEYFARRFLNDGTYEQTNTVTGTMKTTGKVITLLRDIDAPWISLRLSENARDSETFSWSRGNDLQHVRGAKWPDLERSPFEDKTAKYNVAFMYLSDVEAFEALRGEVVILKSRGENVLIGMLSATSKRVTRFYTSFDFSIKQIETEDFTEVGLG